MGHLYHIVRDPCCICCCCSSKISLRYQYEAIRLKLKTKDFSFCSCIGQATPHPPQSLYTGSQPLGGAMPRTAMPIPAYASPSLSLSLPLSLSRARHTTPTTSAVHRKSTSGRNALPLLSLSTPLPLSRARPLLSRAFYLPLRSQQVRHGSPSNRA